MQCIKVKTDTELKLCLALRQQVFVMEQGVPVALEIDHYDTTFHECIHVLILDEDEKAAATGRLIAYKDNMGKLQRIAVREDLRGSGVGREIVKFLEQEAVSSGFLSVVLDAQCSAEQFYAKLGYITLSAEPFLDAGIWHVRMKRDLILHHSR
ncbi:MAG: GCN5-related N-acetyltransferase [Pelosinus sp.]|jgi:predicted GNAT family N-acyltransferase|nr:GCN5-related N-acetyltransferase [Pelosinus sp.]